MKALVWEAPRLMRMRAQADPAPQPGEALIKVAYAGICGSELSGYLGHNALRVPPLVMGHEFAGEIVALGEAARAQHPNLATGQHVTANPMWYCGACGFCARGQTHLCANRRLIGAHRPGAYAEYVAVPAELIAPLPTGLTLRLNPQDVELVRDALPGVLGTLGGDESQARLAPDASLTRGSCVVS
ncbi:MAG TPA: alcohol dehydrogenase catalytic domain-containing protein, partial [Piscinibacter sp.]|nr:alcohol dehydrogenase catalytic domain-containing protein [Piscinibacter sp.]